MKLLVIRLSALGDVAMTVPVVESLRRAYPDVDVTVLTSEAGASVYRAVSNVRVRAVNFKRDYVGMEGLRRLYHELRDEGYDMVADLHNVLRTRFLRMRFHLHAGTRVEKIKKGRAEKYALTHHTKEPHQLRHTVERYRDVFRRLGFDFPLTYTPPIERRHDPHTLAVGVAPFAQHLGKVYPLPQMQAAVRQLLEAEPRVRVYLFGSAAEHDQLEMWAADDERIHNVAGGQTLADDVHLMTQLRCMVSMDSANMHLASLVGTPVVSVWGATHPFAGFLGYGQREENIIQLPLACRPCSIYGKKPCRYGDYHCMTDIAPSLIAERVLSVVRNTEKHEA